MVGHQLVVGFAPEVRDQSQEIVARVRPSPGQYVLPQDAKAPWVRDLRSQPWVSVDNGVLWTEVAPEELEADPECNVDSRDIDQLQGLPIVLDNGDLGLRVAVSDVDAFIKKGSALDRHMDINASSVYTPEVVFNLLPPELAEDIASLNPREDRLATVVEFSVSPQGDIYDEEVYPGLVHCVAKLDYASVGAWLEGKVEPSPAMQKHPDTLRSLQLQWQASQQIREARQRRGSLEFERHEYRIQVQDGVAVGFEKSDKNAASQLVENLMVTVNQVVSRFLRSRGYPTLERVVPPPAQWERIRELIELHGGQLPKQPDGAALSSFLASFKDTDPAMHQEVTFAVIKLIGAGEFRAVGKEMELPGHFPLATKNYCQCTASIRRGGDRIATRMLKAALADEPPPYTLEELEAFATNLNLKGRVTRKVQRAVEKSVIATMLVDRLGEAFCGTVSGVKGEKVWIRISNSPIEGRLLGSSGARVGDLLTVQLKAVDVEKGFIDFLAAQA